MNGVTFENDETSSVFVVDPTLMADEMQAGDASPVGERGEFGDPLHGHDLRPRAPPRDRLAGPGSAARRDTRHVRAVETALRVERTGHRRPRPHLLLSPVGAERLAVLDQRARVTGF